MDILTARRRAVKRKQRKDKLSSEEEIKQEVDEVEHPVVPIQTSEFDADDVVTLITEFAGFGKQLSESEIQQIQSLLKDQNLKLQMFLNAEAVLKAQRLGPLMVLQDRVEEVMLDRVNDAETKDLVAMHKAIQAKYTQQIDMIRKQSQGSELPTLIALLQNIQEQNRLSSISRRVDISYIEDLPPNQRESVRSALEKIVGLSSKESN